MPSPAPRHATNWSRLQSEHSGVIHCLTELGTNSNPKANAVSVHGKQPRVQRNAALGMASPSGAQPLLDQRLGSFVLGAAGFSRFQTDEVQPSPVLLVKSVGRSAPGLAKQGARRAGEGQFACRKAFARL